jgi:hypothetical protein
MNDDAHDANQRRLRQAAKILSLFEDVHGYPARTMEELTKWAVSPEGKRYVADFKDQSGHTVPD